MKRAPKSTTPRIARRGVLIAIAGLGWTALSACDSSPPAPALQYQLLGGSSGSLSALSGKVVLVSFWATSCAPCVKKMPELVATHNKYHPRGFETLAVAMSYDPPAQVARFVQSRALPFGVVIDATGAIARSFGDVKFTPVSFLIDRRGRIAKQYVGETDLAELQARVEKLLAPA